MALRTLKERALQTLGYEAGGLLIASPLYALVPGVSGTQSIKLLFALSLAVMIWAPIYNTVFDLVEWRTVRRLASARPARWRLVHAALLEVSSLVVTCPLVMVLGGYTLAGALLVDLGLTLFYTGYALLFHLVFDWLRPVVPGPRESQLTAANTLARYFPLPAGHETPTRSRPAPQSRSAFFDQSEVQTATHPHHDLPAPARLTSGQDR